MSARLHEDDLETVVGAIEALSAKLDGLGKRPVTIDHRALAELIVGMNADTKREVTARLEDAAIHLQQATDRIDTESEAARQKVLFQRVEAMKETRRETSRKRRWQGIAGLIALLLLLALIAGPWLAHGYFVRTVSGCFALGGHYEAAGTDPPTPAFCAFLAREP